MWTNSPFSTQDLDPQAGPCVVAYGVTARAARVAVAASRAAGKPVSLLIPKTLWPVPERLIVDTAAPYDRVVVVEMNMGAVRKRDPAIAARHADRLFWPDERQSDQTCEQIGR